MSKFTENTTSYNAVSHDEQVQEVESEMMNNEQNSIDGSLSGNPSSTESEDCNAPWDEIDPIYREVLRSGQGFESLGTSYYLGDIQIANHDGQWHVFIYRRRHFSHPDKEEVKKLHAPEVIDAELRRGYEEIYELEREKEIAQYMAEERAELEAERDEREHRVYYAHGYSYRQYYDDYYYDTFFHRY